MKKAGGRSGGLQHGGLQHRNGALLDGVERRLDVLGDDELRLDLARVEERDGQLLVLNELERALAAVDAVDGEARLVQLNAG